MGVGGSDGWKVTGALANGEAGWKERVGIMGAALGVEIAWGGRGGTCAKLYK